MQTRATLMRPLTCVRSKAFRAGYEDFHLGGPPRFDEWGRSDVLYELGRQTAAFAVGAGAPRVLIPSKGRLPKEAALDLYRVFFDLRHATRRAA